MCGGHLVLEEDLAVDEDIGVVREPDYHSHYPRRDVVHEPEGEIAPVTRARTSVQRRRLIEGGITCPSQLLPTPTPQHTPDYSVRFSIARTALLIQLQERS